jgi:hypothetical protein
MIKDLPMTTLDQIERDFSFTFPSSYRSMLAAGLLDHDSQRCIVLSDTEWLTPEEMHQSLLRPPHRADVISRSQPQPRTPPLLLGFAQNGRGDQWAWLRDDRTDNPRIAFDVHDQLWPTFYAPSFEGFVYRLLLEDMASSWLLDRLDDVSQLGPIFQRYAGAVQPYLPAQWGQALMEISRRSPFEVVEGIFAFLRQEETAGLLKRDLNFAQLDQPV